MRIAKEVAEAGAHTVGTVVSLALKIAGTVLLVGLTTLLVFACIFCIYCKTNYSTGLDVEYDEFSLALSSVIYTENRQTGALEELITLTGSEYRSWVDYDDIPDCVEKAVVSIEDQRFYKHRGVDWYRTSGAFVNMFLSMSNTFGGSTITQQLIKNIKHEDDVTVSRKFLEIFRALEYEKHHTKEEIIELYLNVIFFGHGCYGIGAASRYYFGKEVSELTLAEAACIVGITNNPSMYSPFIDRENNKKRQELILGKMLELEYISQAEYTAAVNQELVFDASEDVMNDTVYTWFEEALRDDLIKDLAEMKNVSEGTAELLLLTGGYKIVATVDPKIQAIIDSVYGDPSNISGVSGSSQQAQSAIVVEDPYTGDIVGMSGGIGEKTGNLWWNRATSSRRQPGSSFKPIAAYGPAIEYAVVTPNTKIEDGADVKLNGTSWMTLNFDYSYMGVITIETALKYSINTVAAQLVDKLTPAVSFEFVRSKAGISTLTIEDMDYAPMSIGALSYGVTVRDMTSAYTMFVNNGIRSKGRTYKYIYDNNDKLIYENTTEQVQAISEKTAYWMTYMMKQSASYGTGGVSDLVNMPVAGKTGTTQDRFDRWFVGYTPYYVAACWVGYDNPARISYNGNPAATMWKKVMAQIHDGLEYRSFNVPDDTYLTPIPGVIPITIWIRGEDESGNVLYEEQTYGGKSTVEGREIQVTAKTIPDYELIGSSYTITHKVVYNGSSKDVIVFKYRSTLPPPVEPEEGEEDDSGGLFDWNDIFG
ncbi:MAG: transglycosylase domain-containing protein [Oscillospiraceae bacterium]|nr:transglycosylase domain-containing protein [Oscillospiraceae bacterium]